MRVWEKYIAKEVNGKRPCGRGMSLSQENRKLPWVEITVNPTQQDGKGTRFWAQGRAYTETTGSHKTTRKLLQIVQGGMTADLARVAVVVVMEWWKHIPDTQTSIFTGYCDGLYTTMFHQF